MLTTLEKLIFVLTVLATLGSGLIAGVFFIFSVAVMRALERVPGGMAAMQSINLIIINPMFLGVFLGTALLCIVLGVASVFHWEWAGSGWSLAGCLLYLGGCIGVTMVFNVPMNNALAAADPARPQGQQVWANYLRNWTFWNHIRTGASLGASAGFVWAASAAF
ncbi:MAG TPA: anthrone oxygenase family protein [Pyrinomonadaceae bacterium]